MLWTVKKEILSKAGDLFDTDGATINPESTPF
jgi:hypothetical protein